MLRGAHTALARTSQKFVEVVAVMLFAVTVILLGMDYLIPLFPYAWSDDPLLAAQADADAAFMVLWLSAGCLLLDGMALAIVVSTMRSHPRGWGYWPKTTSGVIAVLGVYRLLSALPYYVG